MGDFSQIAKAFVVGVVGIGLATALFMPGRQTANVLQAGLSGSNSLLHTAISG